MTRYRTPASHSGPASTDDVHAALTFIVPQDTKPRFESAALTGGEPRVHFRTEARRVECATCTKSRICSPDREGFLLVRHETAVDDLYDDEAISCVCFAGCPPQEGSANRRSGIRGRA